MLDRDSGYETIGEWFGCDAETVRKFCQEHKLIPAKAAALANERFELRQAAPTDEEPAISETAMEEEDRGSEDEPDDADNVQEQTPVKAAPSPPHRLTVRNLVTPAGEDSTLLPDDWPDIQTMLAKGMTPRAIAGDYDVEIDELQAFIDEQSEKARQAPKESSRGKPARRSSTRWAARLNG